MDASEGSFDFCWQLYIPKERNAQPGTRFACMVAYMPESHAAILASMNDDGLEPFDVLHEETLKEKSMKVIDIKFGRAASSKKICISQETFEKELFAKWDCPGQFVSDEGTVKITIKTKKYDCVDFKSYLHELEWVKPTADTKTINVTGPGAFGVQNNVHQYFHNHYSVSPGNAIPDIVVHPKTSTPAGEQLSPPRAHGSPIPPPQLSSPATNGLGGSSSDEYVTPPTSNDSSPKRGITQNDINNPCVSKENQDTMDSGFGPSLQASISPSKLSFSQTPAQSPKSLHGSFLAERSTNDMLSSDSIRNIPVSPKSRCSSVPVTPARSRTWMVSQKMDRTGRPRLLSFEDMHAKDDNTGANQGGNAHTSKRPAWKP